MLSELWNKLTAHPSDVSFNVDDVTPAATPSDVEGLGDQLSRRFQRKILMLAEPARPVANPWIGELPPVFRAQIGAARLPVSRGHALIETIHAAFSQHRPLVLSPDAIWLTIAQGFAHHVTAHAEELRPRMVSHLGMRELQAKVPEMDPAAFAGAIADFSRQIREATDPAIHDTLICDFSTTTPAIRTASEVVLMDTYSTYFSYAMMCVCGIPRITVTGSREDWERIRARIEVLETFGLAWWTTRLRPILDEFVRTVSGRPSMQFWKAIYKPRETYGNSVVTGWIADLFPYLGDAPDRKRNHVFSLERVDWAIPAEQGVTTKSRMWNHLRGVTKTSFPSGLSSVPVKLHFPNGATQAADLVAGFFALEQDAASLALSPLINWCIAEPPPAQPVVLIG